jgi:hypothetical protein
MVHVREGKWRHATWNHFVVGFPGRVDDVIVNGNHMLDVKLVKRTGIIGVDQGVFLPGVKIFVLRWNSKPPHDLEVTGFVGERDRNGIFPRIVHVGSRV